MSLAQCDNPKVVPGAGGPNSTLGWVLWCALPGKGKRGVYGMETKSWVGKSL